MPLTMKERKTLKKEAHHLKPLVQIGQKGVTDSLIEAVNQALEDHELIKVKFIDHKDEKDPLIEKVVAATDCEMVSLLGNIATLYRQNPDEKKRKVKINSGLL